MLAFRLRASNILQSANAAPSLCERRAKRWILETSTAHAQAVRSGCFAPPGLNVFLGRRLRLVPAQQLDALDGVIGQPKIRRAFALQVAEAKGGHVLERWHLLSNAVLRLLQHC